MSPSKQFVSKPSSKPKHVNVKVWGNQSQRKVIGLDRTNSDSKSSGYKSFSSTKTTATKIFAPKLTVLNNNIFVGEKIETHIEHETLIDLQKPCYDNESVKQSQESQTQKNLSVSKNNVTSLWGAIIPKISFGKGKKVAKNSTSQKTKIKNPAKSDDRYNPEVIFQKINKTQNFNTTQNPKPNLFGSLKNSSVKATSNWWDSIKFGYYDKAWFRKLNYQFIAFDVAKNFNRFIIGLIVVSVIGFFSYLSIFDQFFTIKKYNIEYLSDSYLNKQQTSELVSHFQKNKLYKVFPNNQYWFANNLSLSASAKEIFPDVKHVSVKNRQWPDQITLQIETNKPILTLWVTENNQLKYWRVNENGKILSQDKAAIWYNLVKIEKPYSIQNTTTEQLSLFNHSFEDDPLQKKRFMTTKLLLDYFESINIQINKTNFPSISDTDIIMESSLGTKFLFDSSSFDANSQIQRLDYFLKSKADKTDFYALHAKGDFAYFDFRVSQKIHTCKAAAKCNIKPE